jgi:membrane-bound serine protease (ClpP class)
MVVEAFVPAFGILGIGGVVAFVIGSVMLLETDAPGFEISWVLIASIGGVSAALFLLGMVLLARARRRPVVTGREEMIGLEGEVIEWAEGEGRVRAHGELWHARAGQPLAPGTKVRVAAVDRLTLVVEPAAEHREA